MHMNLYIYMHFLLYGKISLHCPSMVVTELLFILKAVFRVERAYVMNTKNSIKKILKALEKPEEA